MCKEFNIDMNGNLPFISVCLKGGDAYEAVPMEGRCHPDSLSLEG